MDENEKKTTINTGGGPIIFGNVTLSGGDFVGRDKINTPNSADVQAASSQLDNNLLALKCEACGGKLLLPRQQFIREPTGGFTLSGSQALTCEYCHTEYLPQARFVEYSFSEAVQVHGDVFIETGGDFIGRDLIVSTVDPSEKDKSDLAARPAVGKAAKKWWEFWKR